MSKPRLYIDMDGVLFGYYDYFFQLRPNAVGFLRWAVKYFDCRWLTAWAEPDIAALFSHIYGGDLATKIVWTSWSKQPDESDKARAIDLSQPFYWIEDGILPGEAAYLRASGVYDSY